MPVNMISLQKMVYMANALYLLENDKWLVNEKPIIGKLDPEFSSFSKPLQDFKTETIRRKIRHTRVLSNKGILQFLPFAKEPQLPDKVINVLRLICTYYTLAEYDYKKLTRYTGGTNKQWDEMVKLSGGIGHEIPEHVICDSFYCAVMNTAEQPQLIRRYKFVADIVRFPNSSYPVPMAS